MIDESQYTATYSHSSADSAALVNGACCIDVFHVVTAIAQHVSAHYDVWAVGRGMRS